MKPEEFLQIIAEKGYRTSDFLNILEALKSETEMYEDCLFVNIQRKKLAILKNAGYLEIEPSLKIDGSVKLSYKTTPAGKKFFELMQSLKEL